MSPDLWKIQHPQLGTCLWSCQHWSEYHRALSPVEVAAWPLTVTTETGQCRGSCSRAFIGGGGGFGCRGTLAGYRTALRQEFIGMSGGMTHGTNSYKISLQCTQERRIGHPRGRAQVSSRVKSAGSGVATTFI